MHRQILLALLLSALPSALQAQPGPSPGSLPVRPIFEEADLVCNCLTQSVIVSEYRAIGDAQTATKWHVKVLLEARDVYKSTEAVPTALMVEYEEASRDTFKPSGPRLSLKQGETALVFLKLEGQHYTLVNSPSAVTSFSQLPQIQARQGIGKLRAALAAAVSGANRQDRIRALQLLQGFDDFDSASLAAVEPLCGSDDPETAFAALGVLLKTGTPESVEKLRTYLSLHNHEGNTQPLALISAASRLGQIRDVRSVPVLEDLSTSGFIAVRLGAMEALRSIKSTQSIPALVKRLDDSNTTVQYLAVMALSEIVGRNDADYNPTMNLFDKRPPYYTGLWKKWWEEYGKQKDAVEYRD